MKLVATPRFGVDYFTGTVFFTHTDESFISNGISVLTSIEEVTNFGKAIGEPGKEPGHAILCVGENKGLESVSGGVRFCDLQKEYFSNTKCKIVGRSPLLLGEDAFQQAYAYGFSCLGQGYGYGEIVGALITCLSPLNNWLPGINKWPVFLSDKHRPFCSELIAECFKHTEQYRNIELFKNFHTSRIFPNTLWKYFPWEPLEF